MKTKDIRFSLEELQQKLIKDGWSMTSTYDQFHVAYYKDKWLVVLKFYGENSTEFKSVVGTGKTEEEAYREAERRVRELAKEA